MSDLLVGIDLGTTNSVISMLDQHGQPVPIKVRGENITPSVVQFVPDQDIVFGLEAKQQLALYPQETAQFFKRDMGSEAAYEFAGRCYTPTDLSALLLRYMKEGAEETLGRPVRRAVITVPHYFHDPQRVETKKAAEMAGLEVMQIINEPTAAAFSYGIARQSGEQLILVYDLGGGTFDVCLLSIKAGEIRALASQGDYSLGGKNWDDGLCQYLSDQFNERFGVDPLSDPYAYQELLALAEKAKWDLSARLKTVVNLNAGGKFGRIEVTREAFERISEPLLDQTKTIIEKLFTETSVSLDQVNSVLMVGGSTRMPMCQGMIRGLTGKEPNLGVDPDLCVSFGATLQAHLLSEASGGKPVKSLGAVTVTDVVSHSLGCVVISSDGESFENAIILAKNQEVPASASEVKVLETRAGADNQLSIYLLQGESPRPLDNSLLGQYRFTGVPHYDGETEVRIFFEYDRSGMVQVSCRDEKSGQPLPPPEIKREGIDIAWTDEAPSEVFRAQPMSVSMCIDVSGSMSGDPLEEAKAGVRQFMQNMDPRSCSVGIVSFGSEATSLLAPTQSHHKIDDALDDLEISGSTNMAEGLSQSTADLAGENGTRIIVLLTDGEPNNDHAALEAAREAARQGIRIITIGTTGADTSFLAQISTEAADNFFAESGKLGSVFSDIARNLGSSGGLSKPGGGLIKGLGKIFKT